MTLPAELAWFPGVAPALIGAVVAIVLFTLTFNSMDDLHKALLADITSPAERDTLSGLNVAVEMTGQVAILELGFLVWQSHVPDEAFAITGVLMAVGIVITVLGVPEPSPERWRAGHAAREDHNQSPSIRSAGQVLRRYRGAMVLCTIQFAYWAGLNALLPLLTVYNRDILGATVGQAQLLPGLMLLTTTIVALPVAKLGDRFGRRRVIGLRYALIGCAALSGLVISSVGKEALVFILAGLGTAAISVLNIPLLADLVPRQHMGTATGALAASGSLAAPLASIVAGNLAEVYGLRAIFGLMASMVVVALTLLPAVRPPAPER